MRAAFITKTLKGVCFIASKIDRTVVRNAAYRSGEFNVRERHNERKNQTYHNGDIDPARANMNIHFRRVSAPDGSPETYEQTFNRLLEEGQIVKRGLQKDALVFDELIFDVNSAYFENNGGYEYAKSFFEEAYRLAVKEIGGEQYILSAVMHADERNKALSEEHGRDIYHYHLHVCYVPVVRKEVYFRKDNKNPELAGKLKEVITQISHWKKWPLKVPIEKNGKTVMVNSYSLLQDRFYEHMKQAGFEGFERGERGSTAQHLTDLEFKTKKESERAAAMTAKADEQQQTVEALDVLIQDKQQTATTLDKKTNTKKKQLTELEKRAKVAKKTSDMFVDIDRIGEKKRLFGGDIIISPADWKSVSSLAKEGQESRRIIDRYSDKITELSENNRHLKSKLEKYEAGEMSISEITRYYQARERAPKLMAKTLTAIMSQPPENKKLDNRKKQKSISEER